ncbi:helix-turn-helix domain-containing protein [Bradyrhizobium yuanmingense]|nr:helix-turn-helix domain-containing protein [Bradyrhizobium yuanmingense]
MSHVQFTRDSRVELAALSKAGKSPSECARELGMHRSSITRELTLNTDDDGTYRGASAHKKHLARKEAAKKRHRKLKGALRRYVVRKLNIFWSPEQIAGRLRRKNVILSRNHIPVHIQRTPRSGEEAAATEEQISQAPGHASANGPQQSHESEEYR